MKNSEIISIGGTPFCSPQHSAAPAESQLKILYYGPHCLLRALFCAANTAGPCRAWDLAYRMPVYVF